MGLGFEKIDISPDDNSNNFKLNMHRHRVIQTKSAKEICQNLRDSGLISERVYKLIREELEPIARLPALRTCLTYKKKLILFGRLHKLNMAVSLLIRKAMVTMVFIF